MDAYHISNNNNSDNNNSNYTYTYYIQLVVYGCDYRGAMADVCIEPYQNGEKGVDVAPNGAKNPLLFDRRDEDAGENTKREDQIAQRHAKHQSVRGKRNEINKRVNIITERV